MPRDLKEPEGCKFSSLSQTLHPAILDKAADRTKGVLIHGFDISPSGLSFVIGVVDPILYVFFVFLFVCM